MKKIIFTLLFASSIILTAQEKEEKTFTLSGSVDTYFRGNISGGNFDTAPGSSFANQPGFALGMINLVAGYEGEKVGFVADLVFGPRGTDAIFASPMYSATGNIVNQLYAYWNVSDNVTLTMGNFNTFLGYEVISPAGNFNYSTSYLFSSGPFSHVGLKADFALGEDFSLMLAVMNPTDTNNNTTGDYGFGAQLGYSGQYLNLYYDNDSVLGFEIDYTGGFDLSDSFFLGINGAYQVSDDAGFYGAALYPQLTTSDSFSIGLRGELFGLHAKDVDDLPSVFATTLTGSYTVENLTIKPEVRLDSWSNDEPYVDADGVAAKGLAAFTVAAIYSF